jgi:hypothetical protein
MTNDTMNDALIAALYGKLLVKDPHPMPKAANPSPSLPPTTERKKPVPESNPDLPLLYLGSFERKIGILVHEPEAKHISEASLDFLSRILSACKLTVADVAIVNDQHQSVSAARITQLMPKVVLEFGTSYFSPQTPRYQPVETGMFTLIRSNSLPVLMREEPASKKEKTELWKALQITFLLSP